MKDEMTLKELLGLVLKYWRLLLVLGVVLAFLFGGYRVIASGSGGATEEDWADYQESLQQYRAKMPLLEQQEALCETMLSSAEAYLDDSLLMQVDAEHLTEARVSVSVLPKRTENAASDLAERDWLLGYYASLVQTCPLEEHVSGTKLEKVEERYLRELFTAELDDGVLTLRLICPEGLEQEQACDILYESLQACKKTVTASMGAHTLTVLSRTAQTGVNRTVQTQQLNMLQEPQERMDSLQAVRASIKDLGKEPEKPQAEGVSVSGVVKYTVLGALIGLCLGAAFAFLYEKCFGKVQPDAVSDSLRCQYLGSLAKEKPLRGLDAKARKLYGGDPFAPVAMTDRLPLLAANMKAAMGEKTHVLLTGDVSDKALGALRDSLSQAMGAGYRVSFAAQLPMRAESIALLGDADCAVLAVGETSRMAEITAVTKRIAESQKPLMGVIRV